MKIALIGYGKMGKAIEEIALERGHEIVLKISIENTEDLTVENISKSDVAIEFTGPESAKQNIEFAASAGVNVVCGSTGWLQDLDAIKNKIIETNTGFLYASNFSVGVNIFFELNKTLARLMNGRDEYTCSLEEIHHTAKKDAPSGTAITLAEGILETQENKSGWVLAPEEKENALQITSKRIDPAPGTHIIRYQSSIDDIEISHTAHSRKGFALGAVLAAEFLNGKKGIYSMADVLKIK